MNVEYHKWWSSNLGHDMELKVYGHAGKALVVFPTSGGRFYQYEDFGMVDACRSFIDQGKIKLFAVDSVDYQTWLNHDAQPADRARRHGDFDRYIVDEVAPFVIEHGCAGNKFLATGCSLGAYHAANFFFRHPEVFDALIALSGLYSLHFSVGGYMDDNVYFNSPLAYLPGMEDPWYLDQYRRSAIIICTGQGAWENGQEDAREIQRILREKDVPCWVDFWGHDVNHDWPWWRIQMPYFLDHLNL
jgi:esterase/lipase superfamily enzyme